MYSGNATGWDSNSSANTWTTISAVDLADAVFHSDDATITFLIYTPSLNPSYGYYAQTIAKCTMAGSNLGYAGALVTSSSSDGTQGSELPSVTTTHTQATALTVRLRIVNLASSAGKRLQIQSNVVGSAGTGAPTMKVAVHRHTAFG